jgi:hypothetical protein
LRCHMGVLRRGSNPSPAHPRSGEGVYRGRTDSFRLERFLRQSKAMDLAALTVLFHIANRRWRS